MQASMENSGALLGEFAAVAAELLSRASAAASEVANSVSERVGDPGGAPSIPELTVDVIAGKNATHGFAVWNTGSTALRKVTLQATELLGAEHHSLKEAITFRPPIVPQVGPGKSVEVAVDVAVPKSTQPGTYRGLIQAEPGDTCAVLMVSVKAAPKPAPRSSTAKRRAKS